MRLSPSQSVAVRPATTDDIEFIVQLFLALAVQRNPNREGLNVEAIVHGTREATSDRCAGKSKTARPM
jgi:hypothetical protein